MFLIFIDDKVQNKMPEDEIDNRPKNNLPTWKPPEDWYEDDDDFDGPMVRI